MIRTTVNVNKELLEEAERIAGQKNASAVINAALEEFVQSRALEELLSLRGKLLLDMDWQEMERLEMAEFEGSGE